MNPILDIAREHNLWIVEDAACAFGAKYDGRHAGTFGEMAAFSFHPRKSITTGEGGMVTTQDERLDALCRSLRDHGASRSDLARHEQSAAFLLAEYNHLGYNFRMTDIQGALGCAQMKRADFILAERTKRAARYDEMLSNISWLQTPLTPSGYVHGYQSYVCLFQPEEPTLRNVARLNRQRNELMTMLESEGISTRQGTHAAALAGYYAKKYDLRPELFPNACLAEQLSLTLPLFAQMTDDEQSFVCESLEATLSARISA